MFNIRVTDYTTFYDPVKKLLCQSGQRRNPTFPHSNGTSCGSSTPHSAWMQVQGCAKGVIPLAKTFKPLDIDCKGDCV